MKTLRQTQQKILSLFLSLLIIVTALPFAVLPVNALDITGTLSNTGYVTLIHGDRSLDAVGYDDRILTYSDSTASTTSLGSLRFDISSLPDSVKSASFTYQVQKVTASSQNIFGVYVAMKNESIPAVNSSHYVKDTAIHSTVFGTVFGVNDYAAGNSAETYYEAQRLELVNSGDISTSYTQRTVDITSAVNNAKAKGLTTLNVFFMHPCSDSGNSEPWTDVHIKPSSTSISMSNRT